MELKARLALFSSKISLKFNGKLTCSPSKHIEDVKSRELMLMDKYTHMKISNRIQKIYLKFSNSQGFAIGNNKFVL